MKITLDRSSGGYATAAVETSGIDGLVAEKPFLLLTGPNGSGKSAVLRGIRATIGLRGERLGAAMRTTGMFADPIPMLFDVGDLGWTNQKSYLFDSRAASGMANKADFGDDMMYHASLIVGGGAKVSHGQFVRKTWWDALSWCVEKHDGERWLFVDEPETAIDAEALLIGLAVMLETAEIGRLRILCASHSLLFAVGLMNHPKVQTFDMGGKASWMETQRIALKLASDPEKLANVGRDFVKRLGREPTEDGRGERGTGPRRKAGK